MLLSRQNKKKQSFSPEKSNKPNLSSSTLSSDIHDYLQKTDFSGALAILNSKRRNGANDVDTLLWIAYCHSHLGDYKTACKEYRKMLKSVESSGSASNLNGKSHKETIGILKVLSSIGLFMQGDYEVAKKMAEEGKPHCQDIYKKLAIRVLFHVSHKLDEQEELLDYHRHLEDRLDDQLTLASMHYMRDHHQQALDIYKEQLRQNPTYLALNVYVALCYYKMDHHDISQEVLQVYLEEFPDSAIATNLKACNLFKLFSSKAAVTELRRISDISSSHYSFCRELISHNLVVFKNGEGAQQILPSLVGVVPEAVVNLAIYYLKQDEVEEAYKLVENLDPQTPQEYTIKGTVLAMYGQKKGSKEHLNRAHNYFQVVGCSSTECDTVPGRQAMASCFFLLKQFEDVLIYLASIKMYYSDDDTFNYNYGQAKAALGKWSDAEDALLRVNNEDIKSEYTYLATLTRACIKNKHAKKAWQLYLKLDPQHPSSFDLLQLLANDCYKTGQFLYAAKAFDVLERLDQSDDTWLFEGKIGACIGLFQLVMAELEPKDALIECLMLLRNSENPQADYVIGVISNWAENNGLIPTD